ncbi:MAG: mechanosensitive ion channel family protein [Gammaproteobacteria bacterium]|nr:mechanosensitive ion channel family protein [Gammaproteobacteria bacterium]MCP5136021.1 mechanosensitive ion channel family protein [Gammaproteobacteria bacterium]
MPVFRSTLRRLLLIPLLAVTFFAQAEESTGESNASAVAPELISPRATMATFLHAMNDIGRGQPGRIDDAVMTLDLSNVSPLVRRERGEDLAWMLLDVLDRTRKIDLDRIPEDTRNGNWLFERYRAGSVTITRQADGSWLFSKRTIADLPAMSDEVSGLARRVGGDDQRANQPLHLRLRDALPGYMKAAPFLLENWRWLALFVLIVLGVLLDRIVSWFLAAFVRRYRQRSSTYQDVRDRMLRPLGLMAMAVLWWVGVNLLGLPEQALLVLLVAVKFLAGISAVWTAYRLVDLLTAWMRKRAAATESTLDDALVPLAQRSFKIFVTVIGAVFVADNMNIDISSLLAGLGLGGLAFALAAKDMVQNLFGSITVLLDRTFSVGDWIVTEGVEGSVEEIGFRSTRVRTFYNSVVTLPNSAFITASVDNMGKRRYRRLKTTLGLTYDTPPEHIEAFCEALRELVRQHPYMRKDYFQIYFNDFGAASLDVLVYVFWETPDWSTELRERQRFLLDILRVAKDMNVEFAFPTQTLYLRDEHGWQAPQGAGNDEESALEMGRATGHKIAAAQGNAGAPKPPVRF